MSEGIFNVSPCQTAMKCGRPQRVIYLFVAYMVLESPTDLGKKNRLHYMRILLMVAHMAEKNIMHKSEWPYGSLAGKNSLKGE